MDAHRVTEDSTPKQPEAWRPDNAFPVAEIDFDPNVALVFTFDWAESIPAELAYNIACFGDSDARLTLLRHPDCTVRAVREMTVCSDPEVVVAALAHPMCTANRKRAAGWLRRLMRRGDDLHRGRS